MALIFAQTPLYEVIISSPEIIPVINRFGITLGIGDKTIECICTRNRLDTDFFLSILNTYINEDYFPEKALESFHISTLVEYLRKTNNYYLRYHLPTLERHFNLLIERSGNHNNLGLMMSFFKEVKHDIESRITFDFEQWFPTILNITKGENAQTISIPDDSYIIEDKLNDLKSMFIRHISGDYDENLCYAVISSIIAIENDIKQNNRIRDRIVLRLYNNLTNNQQK